MSKVATDEGRALQLSPQPLRQFWSLTIIDSALTGELQGFEIMSQQPTPAGVNVNRLFGGVDTSGSQTMLSLMDGVTDVVEQDGKLRQIVSFEIIVRGVRFNFDGGVLSADGSRITDGFIEKDSEFEPDGTWSATAVPGPPTDRPGKGKGRRQAGRNRR